MRRKIMKTAIITDSNSGITQREAKELGIFVVPMPVLIDGEMFLEDISITQEQFYEKLKGNANVSTSQPNPFDVGEIWDKALETHDEIVYIPMSSGKVYVVNNQRISITQRQSTLDGIEMAKEGKSGKEIYDYLMQTKMLSSIYIMVDTLKFLKKGGRLTPAVAAIGTLLKIKPVLQIQGEKLDQYAKVRKLADAKVTMINALKKDFETRFKDLVAAGKMTLQIAHTQNLEEAEKFKQELLAAFPGISVSVINPLSLSVSCHIGPGALAAACSIVY